MPTIEVQHGNPLSKVIADLGAGLSGAADSFNDRERLDAYLERAKQTTAIQRAEEQRRQAEFEADRTRRPQLEQQQDRFNAARTRGLELGNEADQLELDRRRARSMGPHPLVGDDDPELQVYTTAQKQLLNGVSPETVDPFELSAVQAKFGTRAALLRNGYSEIDQDVDINTPQGRAERARLRQQLRSEFMQLDEAESEPLRRSHVGGLISKARTRGHLQSNPEAQAALDVLLEQVKEGVESPEAIYKRFANLRMGVRTDIKDMRERSRATNYLSTLADQVPFKIALQIDDLAAGIETDEYPIDQAVRRAEKLAGQGTDDDPRVKATELAMRYGGATREERLQAYQDALEMLGGNQAPPASGGVPFDLGGSAASPQGGASGGGQDPREAEVERALFGPPGGGPVDMTGGSGAYADQTRGPGGDSEERVEQLFREGKDREANEMGLRLFRAGKRKKVEPKKDPRGRDVGVNRGRMDG